MTALPLSALDLVPAVAGATSGEALRASLALARRLDALGYARVWYAEHHNMPMIASTTPALMIALAGEVTTRLRVGAGGVMLPNHASLQVAESYKMLEALHPGRVDLGIGRAPGTDPRTAFALRRARELLDAEDFPAQLAELMAYGPNSIPPGHRLHGVRAMPEDVPLPPIWLLGSSDYSARMAAILGLGFGFAAHFSPTAPEGPMLDYRAEFEAAGHARPPHAILAVAVICAETAAEAERLAAPMQLAWVRLRSGRIEKLPTIEEALAYAYSPMEQLVVESYRELLITGDPATVKARIEEIATRTRADEVMISTIVPDYAARERSYALVAEAFGLGSR
jgi:luciferase family oxidoreductase group 1